MLIQLRDLMDDDDGWGREHGRKVHDRLLQTIEGHPSERIFTLSLSRIRRSDAAFAREGVLELVRRFRRRRGLCLVDMPDDDTCENWDAAALRAEQPLTLWRGDRAQILGPLPTEGTRAILDHLLTVPNATASDCALKFGIQIANSSNKLRYLFDSGYVLRTERPSGSGGIEHIYYRIR